MWMSGRFVKKRPNVGSDVGKRNLLIETDGVKDWLILTTLVRGHSGEPYKCAKRNWK